MMGMKGVAVMPVAGALWNDEAVLPPGLPWMTGIMFVPKPGLP